MEHGCHVHGGLLRAELCPYPEISPVKFCVEDCDHLAQVDLNSWSAYGNSVEVVHCGHVKYFAMSRCVAIAY